jgi:hypothetical protein
MNMPANDNLESESQAQPPEPADTATDVDLEELASKVFELLLQELKIENDRTGKS